MNWSTASALATAGGTLVLAIATFLSVRSANRSAKAAERSLLAGLRPLLVASRPQDLEQKIGFIDQHYVRLAGGSGTAEATEDAVYLTMSLRNVGPGVAVLDGWYVHPERLTATDAHPPAVDSFHRLTRDIYVASGDIGFWQGALRDPEHPQFQPVSEAVIERGPLTVDLLYGDFEGGQRVISRFSLMPRETDGWLLANARHWNLDRPNPRS
ncbi:MAG: hypothetical protein JWP14_258 [Frankiales bacterium]|nr:hypothetical protein [Frankiales bacterium]